ncbi:MAG: 23S rRNA (guanosine(2251)-2'-O)-methyltransferase RlmB [Deltaproteobacteria bacterium]|nr:23S rRNA (guanosine(2251)-2'-O)-methyltransferase RlmB [Deltaproteobacteria bacterium]
MAGEIIYGLNPVLEALKAERSLRQILVAEGRKGAPLKELFRLARARTVPVHLRPRPLLDRLAGTEHHQGVMAVASPAAYTPWEDFLRDLRARPAPARILILDGIQDPQNLGSLIRTAEVCGLGGVIIPKDRAAGLTPAVLKSSAGAAAHLPVVRVTNLARTLEELKEEGFWIVGADPRGEKSLYEMNFEGNIGLVIGSEGQGIRPLLLKKCDFRVAIPMKGKVASLNAAVAGAIILFEILRQDLSRRDRKEDSASPS